LSPPLPSSLASAKPARPYTVYFTIQPVCAESTVKHTINKTTINKTTPSVKPANPGYQIFFTS